MLLFVDAQYASPYAMSVFVALKEKGIPYGDSFHSVGNNSGPGNETGAKGPAPTLYMNDPNQHLIEIRTYD